MNTNKIPHIIIIGAGFAGLEVARGLANAPVRITLIDKNNHHLFQPLLYQVAIAGLLPSQVALHHVLLRETNNSFAEWYALDNDKQ